MRFALPVVNIKKYVLGYFINSKKERGDKENDSSYARETYNGKREL